MDTDTDSNDSDDAEEGDETSNEESEADGKYQYKQSKLHLIIFEGLLEYYVIFVFVLEDAKQAIIIDNTETTLKILRRTIYLTIHSSLDFEECAHKLLKMQLKPGQEIELCHMILDCCAENRTYEKFFGLLAGVSLYRVPFLKLSY